MKNYDNYRLDYVFSYWIFLWFVLYYYKIVKYSPLFLLLIALVENVFIFIYLIFIFIIENSYYNFLKLFAFIIINFFIKILPLYYIIKIENNVKTIEDFINKVLKSIKLNDIIISFYLFLIYVIWLFINKIIIINNNYQLKIKLQTTTPLYNIIYSFFNPKDYRLLSSRNI
jgi:hypothetical protein